MNIVVVARQNSHFWYCIPSSFSSCPNSQTFYYANSSELRLIAKAEWVKIGQCPKLVTVINTATGHTKNTFPISLQQRAPLNA